MKKLAIVVAMWMLLFSLGVRAQGFGFDTHSNPTEAPVDSGRQDRYAVLDGVLEDGSNLRQILAGLDIVVKVIPFSPATTFIVTDSGAGLFRGGVLDSKTIEFAENLHRICRGEWSETVPQKDVMTDKVLMVKRIIPANELKKYFPTHDSYGSREASCGDTFTYLGNARRAFIFHKVEQAFIWKDEDLNEPKSKDDLPPDGIVPKSWFKPKERYPSFIETVAWANRICSLRGGIMKMAYWRYENINGIGQRTRTVQKDFSVIARDFPSDDFFIHCDANSESFLIRYTVERENKIEIPKMVIQRNRDLASVGF